MPSRDLGQKIGQLFWIGFEGTAWGPDLARLVTTLQPGGLILFSRNIESAPQVRGLADALHRSLSLPPFIALDQEGGRVNRLRPILGPSTSSLLLASRKDAAGVVRRQARATAMALKTLGFNVNLAPVVDLSGSETNNGIGDRAFGTDPETVAALAKVHVQAHLRSGILPVAKHFPGLGGAGGDSHEVLPVIRRSRSVLWKRDLVPYRRLRNTVPMIMAGHAYYPALQGGRRAPATLSRMVVEGLLRRRIGFRGIILTDDLEMGAVDQRLDGGALALAALEAGNDGLMFCRSAERILEAREALIKAVESGALPSGRVDGSLRRILAAKRRWLAGRRRPTLSQGTLTRSRLVFDALEPSVEHGFDPTARA